MVSSVTCLGCGKKYDIIGRAHQLTCSCCANPICPKCWVAAGLCTACNRVVSTEELRKWKRSVSSEKKLIEILLGAIGGGIFLAWLKLSHINIDPYILGCIAAGVILSVAVLISFLIDYSPARTRIIREFKRRLGIDENPVHHS